MQRAGWGSAVPDKVRLKLGLKEAAGLADMEVSTRSTGRRFVLEVEEQGWGSDQHRQEMSSLSTFDVIPPVLFTG